MKFDIRRVAAAGAVSALAAGALVAGTATTASAASASTDYGCSTLLGPQTIPTTFDVPALDAPVPVHAGQFFPLGILDLISGGNPAVTMTFTLPAAVVPTLTALGVTGVSSPDLAMAFGNSSVPASGLTLVGITPNTDGSANAVVTATNAAFNAPAGGPQDITMPSSFNLAMATASSTVPVVNVACSAAAPAKMTTLTILKNDSTTTAKAARTSFVKGKTAKVLATVAAANHMPSGKVLLKNKAGKTLDSAVLNSLGKATLATSKLPVGKNALKVLYRGDGYTNKSNAPVTVKIVR